MSSAPPRETWCVRPGRVQQGEGAPWEGEGAPSKGRVHSWRMSLEALEHGLCTAKGDVVSGPGESAPWEGEGAPSKGRVHPRGMSPVVLEHALCTAKGDVVSAEGRRGCSKGREGAPWRRVCPETGGEGKDTQGRWRG